MSSKMFSVVLTTFGFLCLALFSPVPCTAQEGSPLDTSVRQLITDGLAKEKDICRVVREIISTGNDTSDTVNSSILMGYPACVVVRCAIEAGGKLEDVITAAYKAGATSDIIVTCLVDAGVDTDVLARIIDRLGLPGLGYTPVVAAPGYSPTFSQPIGGGGGGTVSPIRP